MTTTNKLLILDKDGTLTTTVSGEKFVQHPKDQQLLPGVAEALKKYADDGWLFAIASNQGGVAAGHKTLDDAVAEMRHCMELIGDCLSDVAPDHLTKLALKGYLCPDFGGEKCIQVSAWSQQGAYKHQSIERQAWRKFRKPDAGMIQAAWYYACMHRPISDGSVLFIGDRPEDQQAATNAGIPFMWAHEWRGASA